MKSFFVACGFSLLVFGCFRAEAAAPPAASWSLGQVKMSPDAVFANESTAITVTAELKLAKGAPAPALSLVQVDEQGNRVRYIGVLSDDGVMGDFKAGDGIYSRKFQISEKHKDRVYFAVVPDDRAVSAHPMTAVELKSAGSSQSRGMELRVIARPSFIQMLGEVWQKIQAGFRKPIQS